MMSSAFRIFLNGLTTILVLASVAAYPAVAVACTSSWLDPVDGDWDDPSRWSASAVPTATDDVCISVAGTYTVRVTGAAIANRLTVGDPGVSNTQTLRIEGGAVAAELTLISELQNAGRIVLDSVDQSATASIYAVDAWAQNYQDALIISSPGAGGARVLALSNLQNQGRLQIDTDTLVGDEDGYLHNSNELLIASGATLTIDPRNNAVLQSQGTLQIDGALTIDTGTLYLSGGTVTGTPVLTDGYLYATVTPLTVVARGITTLTSDIAVGQTLIINDANGVATLQLGEYDSDLTNAGTLVIETVEGSNPATIAMENGFLQNFGTIEIRAGAGGARTILADYLFNQGSLTLESDTLIGGDYASISNSSGDLIIAPGATLTVDPRGNQFFHSGGLLEIGGALVFENAVVGFGSGTITGIPLLTDSYLYATVTPLTAVARGITTLATDIAVGQTLIINDANGVATLQLDEYDSDLSNAGTLVIETVEGSNPATIAMENGFLQNFGSIEIRAGAGGARTILADYLFNQGSLTLESDTLIGGDHASISNSSGDLIIAPGATLTVDPRGNQFFHSGGLLEIGGALVFENAVVGFGSGTITGIPLLTDSYLYATVTPLTVVARGITTLASDIAVGQTLIINDANGVATLQLDEYDSDLTNAGTLVIETVEGSNPATIAMENGFLQNFGTIEVRAGAGGARTILADYLFNQGSLTLESDTLIGGDHASISNSSGDLIIAPGATLTVDPRGNQFFHSGGLLEIGGALVLENAMVGFGSGTITGIPVVTDSYLYATVTPLTVVARGITTLGSDIAVGQTLIINDANGVARLQLDEYGYELTNAGTLVIESVEGSNPATIDLTGDSLQNYGTIHINAGAGGARTVAVNTLWNQGTLHIDSSTLLGGNDAWMYSTGNVLIDANATLTIDPRSNTFIHSSGLLDIAGTFTITDGAAGFFSGTINGIPQLTDSLVGFGTASLTVDAYGDSKITGDIAAGQTLRVHDADGAGSLRAEFPGANLTNDGTLILESVAGANPIDLLFADGSFFNNGTIDLNAGTGGTRSLTTQLTNDGVLNVRAPATGGVAATATYNSGTININDTTSAGSLALAGDYQQNGDGVLTIEIGGVARSGDPLAVAGTAAFGGTLDIELLSSACEPDNFTLVSYANYTTEFATILGLDLGGGRELEPSYDSTALTVALHDPACATPTPTSTSTDTPTETPTETPTDTPTATPTETPTFTPTATPTETPTDTPTPTPTPTDTPTDTPTATPTDTPTQTPTDTPTATPTNTPTPTFTWTPTRTPTRTWTPTPTYTPTATPTPTPDRHAVLFFSWEDVGKGITRNAHHYGVAAEANTSFILPANGRISHLTVNCSAGITSGSHTVTLRKNEANTALACVLSSGATSCTDTDNIDFVAGDLLNLQIVNAASTQKPNCQAMATLTGSGGTSPYDSVITLHTDAESPADGAYCGMKIGTGSTATTCTSSNANEVAIVMPRSTTLTALAVMLNNTIPAGKSETYTVRNLTTAADASLAVTIAAGSDNGSATCSGSCTVSAGDRLAIRYNRVGTQTSRTRSFALTYVGGGSVLTARRNHFNSGTMYGNHHLSVNDTVAGAPAVRMDRAAKLQRLYVHSSNTTTTAYTVTVCSGTTSPPSCTGTRPQCTVAAGATTCNDTTNSASLAAGDYVEVRVTGQGNTSGTVGFSVEVADP